MEFRPVPKPKKVIKKKKRKTKKAEIVKGTKVPARKKRSAISKKEYNRALKHHGEYCAECGYWQIEMHHVVFRSQGGRGGYRNLVPLCNNHHQLAHKERQFANKWRDKQETLYGPYYYMDKYDLYKLGLVPNLTDKAFEDFMKDNEQLTWQKNIIRGEL